MTAESAIPQILGRARFLLLVITLVAPVMAAALDPGAAAAASFTTLFEFPGGSNGAGPFTPLTQGADSALYGMTRGGGGGSCASAQDCGTIFRLTPPRAPSTQWSWTVLYRFKGGSDGQLGSGLFPKGLTDGGPVLGEDGSLYGTTPAGGDPTCASTVGCGTVFKLTPSRPGEPWTKTILHAFRGGRDGSAPLNPLVEGADGAFYGLSQQGGERSCFFDELSGCGTFFKLTPPAGPGGAWKASVVYRETGADFLPNPGLTQFRGAFYYTALGGFGCGGAVSRIAPKPGGGWRNEVLSPFNIGVACPVISAYYGVLVEPGIVFGAIGFLEPGPANSRVFALTPPPRPGARWDMEILHEFPNFSKTDGTVPAGAVVAGAHGVIFGATSLGGSQNCGTVWQLTPPAAAGRRWTEQILHDFQNGADGCHPASIGPGLGGVLYGTARTGGSTGNGTVFEIVP